MTWDFDPDDRHATVNPEADRAPAPEETVDLWGGWPSQYGAATDTAVDMVASQAQVAG